ncbi:MAG: hypothetical protein KF852_04150 [Saprospiraceae bacterium]|nr:hypothetical protein [Saprospiraceae bacterium]
MSTQQQTHNVIDTIKSWLFPLLLAGLGTMVQLQYNSISADMKDMKLKLEKMDKDQALSAREFNYIDKKLNEHERWLEQLDDFLYKRK